jgi:Putative nucleotidyltransferase DUF294
MQQAPPPSAVRPTADRPYDPSQPGRTGRCCVHGGDRPGPHPPSAPEELAAYAREVTTVAARLVGAGTPPADITRFLTSAYDALYVRAARDGEAALGPAPCPYALLVLGSGARRESTLRTDQDHALVVADGAPPGADGWFAALAEHLAATLEQCGLVRCPGTTSWPPTRPGRCVGCTRLMRSSATKSNTSCTGRWMISSPSIRAMAMHLLSSCWASPWRIGRAGSPSDSVRSAGPGTWQPRWL